MYVFPTKLPNNSTDSCPAFFAWITVLFKTEAVPISSGSHLARGLFCCIDNILKLPTNHETCLWHWRIMGYGYIQYLFSTKPICTNLCHKNTFSKLALFLPLSWTRKIMEKLAMKMWIQLSTANTTTSSHHPHWRFLIIFRSTVSESKQ